MNWLEILGIILYAILNIGAGLLFICFVIQKTFGVKIFGGDKRMNKRYERYTQKQLETMGETFDEIVNEAVRTDKPVFAGIYTLEDGTRKECYIISGPLGSRKIQA